MQLKTKARKGVAGSWGPDKCVVAPGRQQRGGRTQHHLEVVQASNGLPLASSSGEGRGGFLGLPLHPQHVRFLPEALGF